MPFVQYGGSSDTDRTPSPVIWADCPTQEILHQPGFGYHFFDDMMQLGTEATFDTTTAGDAVRTEDYYMEGDIGVTVANVAAAVLGQIQIANNDADEDGAVLMHNLDSGYAHFGVDQGASVWFEARIKQATVADDASAMFIGLYENTVAPTGDATLVDATGIPDASEDFVGWWINPASGAAITPIYQEGNATRVNVGSASSTIVADTFYKVGLRYRGDRGTQGQLEYFFNGGLVATLDVTSALSFPDANHLNMLWAVKTTAAGAVAHTMDWWRVAAVSDESQ